MSFTQPIEIPVDGICVQSIPVFNEQKKTYVAQEEKSIGEERRIQARHSRATESGEAPSFVQKHLETGSGCRNRRT